MALDKMTLEQRIALLEAAQNGDTVPAEQVRELIAAVKEMFGQNAGNLGELRTAQLYQEIGTLAKFINGAKKELQEVQTSQLTGKEIPGAASQLDAIVQMTEQATGTIMDECDRLGMFHGELRDRLLAIDPPVDPDAMASVDAGLTDAGASITKIYEACNFQDITGQRIQKVVSALQEIERQVLRMVVVFGLLQNDAKLDEETKEELREDAQLLNGPQLSGQGLEQDDIDALLAKLL